MIWTEDEAPAQGRGVVLRPGPEPGPFFNGVVVVGYKPTLNASADPRGGIGLLSLGQFISQTQWTSVIGERSQKRRPIGAGRRSRGGLRPLFAPAAIHLILNIDILQHI